MKALVLRTLLVIAAIVPSGRALALSMLISPPVQSALVGDSVSVDIVATDFGTDVISAYDLTISFDGSVLLAESTTFAGALGDESLLEVLNSIDLSTSGLVRLSQLSLLSDGELASRQIGQVVLATVFFGAVAPGESVVGFSSAPISQVVGRDAELVAVDLQDGVIIVGSSAPLPEPSLVLLLALGGAVVAIALRAQAIA